MKKQKLEAIRKSLESELGLEIEVAENESRAYLTMKSPTGVVVAKIGLGWNEYFQRWYLGSFEDALYETVKKAVRD